MSLGLWVGGDAVQDFHHGSQVGGVGRGSFAVLLDEVGRVLGASGQLLKVFGGDICKHFFKHQVSVKILFRLQNCGARRQRNVSITPVRQEMSDLLKIIVVTVFFLLNW